MPLILGVVFFGAASGAQAIRNGIFAILFPVIYGAIGFVLGAIVAALYNVVAKWTGGLEFEVTDVPPTA